MVILINSRATGQSGWHLSIEGGGEVSHETVLQHTLDEEVDGGKVVQSDTSVTPAPPVGKPAFKPCSCHRRQLSQTGGIGRGILIASGADRRQGAEMAVRSHYFLVYE